MDKVNKTMLISLMTNIFLAVFKIVFGILGSSGALIADGIHSLSDMITDIFAGIGNIISKKPADYEHPFGHGNAEYLTCLVIGIIIAIMGINVINEGISKGITIPSVYVSLISLTTIIIKLFLSKYIIKKGKELDSNILISSGKESFTDVISSLIVFISVLLSKLSNINELFKYSDKIAMIIVGILIIKIAFEILRDNLSNLLGKRINDHDYEKQIDNIILNHKGIEKVDSLIIVKFGSFKKIDCEVSMDENMKLKKVHQTIDHIEKELKIKDDTISNIIIHVNPYKSV
ncbi:MAG: cation transporter [Bacilli bacterium]|nr:cation transporter [Bacilli bacterium]